MKLISILGILIIFSTTYYFSTADFSKPQTLDEVVIIIKNPVVNNRFRFSEGHSTTNGSFHELEYINDSFIPQFVGFSYNREYDTIKIPTQKDFLEVNLSYKAIDNLSYLFEKGDSILISYQGNKPIIELLNRPFEYEDYKVELLIRDKIHKHEFPSEIMLRHPILFHAFDYTKSINTIEKDHTNLKADYLNEINTSKLFLDSLFQHKLISPKGYSYYKAKLGYNTFWKDITYKKYISGSYKRKIEDALSPRSDSLLQFRYYREKLFRFYKGNFRGNSDQSISFEHIYDQVSESELFTEKEKNLILLDNYKLIVKLSSLSVVRAYFEKLKKDIADSSLIQYIRDHTPGIGEPLSYSMELQTLDSNRIDFSQLLEHHQNKVIYIDFWASWCRPCIAAFTDAYTLREHYKNKEVSFVYLSIDDSKESWKRAAQKYDLTEDSFLIANRFTSKLFEQLNVKSIPRYMIYDKKGKLAIDKAPGPGKVGTKQLIDSYLNE